MEPLLNKSLRVIGLPACITVEDLVSFFSRFGPLVPGQRSGSGGITGALVADKQSLLSDKSTTAQYGVRLYDTGENAVAPHSLITFSDDAPAYVAAEAVAQCAANNRCLTVTQGWHSCVVQLSREPKRQRIQKYRARLAEIADREAAKQAAWRPEMLDHFPSHDSSLDPRTLISELPFELQEFVAAFLTHRFPHSTSEVPLALKCVWQNHPKSLRVKELFETVEAYALISQQLDLIRSQGRCRRSRSAPIAGRLHSNAVFCKKSNASLPVDASTEVAIDTIIDMACGHGLLGVLLAYRFADLQVICVDIERGEAFDDFVAAFKRCGTPELSTAEQEPLSNIEFHQGDMSSLRIPPRSFVCAYACNEAIKVVIDMAQESDAAYAVIPSCTTDGLYSVETIRDADVTARYAARVGIIAGTHGAHSIACIDRRITKHNMCIFGGFPFGGVHSSDDSKTCFDHHE